MHFIADGSGAKELHALVLVVDLAPKSNNNLSGRRKIKDLHATTAKELLMHSKQPNFLRSTILAQSQHHLYSDLAFFSTL